MKGFIKLFIFCILLTCFQSVEARKTTTGKTSGNSLVEQKQYQDSIAHATREQFEKSAAAARRSFESQSNAARENFDSIAAASWERYQAYRDSANKAYAEALSKAWAPFNVGQPEEMPIFIDPKEAPECTDSFLSEAIEYIADKIIDLSGKIRNIVKEPRPFIPRPKSKALHISARSLSEQTVPTPDNLADIHKKTSNIDIPKFALDLPGTTADNPNNTQADNHENTQADNHENTLTYAIPDNNRTDDIPGMSSVHTEPTVRPVSSTPLFHFDFYGTDCSVRLDTTERLQLKSIMEWSVANAWQKLSENKYDEVLNDCMWLRDSLCLHGWSYYSFLKSFSEAYLGAGTNESILLQAYILVQSGYRARLGKSGNRLILLMSSDDKIYSHSHVKLNDGYTYYLFGTGKGANMFSVVNACSQSLGNDEVVSIRLDTLPLLAQSANEQKYFTSKRYPSLVVNHKTNGNLIHFMNDYPVHTNWVLYSMSSLCQTTKDAIYPTLKKYIRGKDEQEAANILINFVQTAFEYKTDGEQFGYERPLFGDEIFYYPYSDCEDRAILFSILVRDLLGLDVVFIYYPQCHLATAVKFRSNVSDGSFVNLDDGKYTICDPTYIGAGIGQAMPKLRNTAFDIVLIK